MKSFLTKSSALWVMAILMIGCIFGFWYVMRTFDFLLIDEIWDPDQVRAHIANLSEKQRQVHIWTTATLDVAFPLFYGGLFVGLAWRFLGTAGPLLALPGLAVIPIDLTEGVIQIMALSGNEVAAFHKVWVTPLKLGLFIAAAIVALIAIGVAISRRLVS